MSDLAITPCPECGLSVPTHILDQHISYTHPKSLEELETAQDRVICGLCNQDMPIHNFRLHHITQHEGQAVAMSTPKKKAPTTPVQRPKPKSAGGTAPLRPKRALSAVERDVVDIATKRARIKALNAEVDQLQRGVIAHMEAPETPVDTITVKDGGETYTCTRVAGESVTTDEPALKKRIGAPVWKKLTIEVLDKSKLEAAIKSGEVDEMDVAAASTITPRKTFVKVTKA